MNYSKAIRVARSLADISQGALADKAEIDRSYLSLIESGKRKPTVETIEKIAIALQIPFHLLSLLGSEESDVKNASQEQIVSLSQALTKLLFEVPSEESVKGNDERSSPMEADCKLTGSRVSPRRKSRESSRVGRKLAK